MKRLLYLSLIFSAMLIAIVAVQAAEPEPESGEAETEQVYRTEQMSKYDAMSGG